MDFKKSTENSCDSDSAIRVFLCGDVMTGRGIDQILSYPSDPVIHEPYLKNANGYVRLAEMKNGAIPKPVNFSYIWGDVLFQLERMEPDLRLINLETSITKSDEYWRGKGIHYRMNPKNIGCITAAKIDYCALANNHVLDWGYSGLVETLETLAKVNVKFSGAGKNSEAAESPATLEVKDKGRILVFSFGLETSGIPREWAASENTAGVNLLEDLSETSVQHIRKQVEAVKGKDDVALASIHWGSNWGYTISSEQRQFAHELIDSANIDVIHGHSSHHPRGMEVYRDKLILYGCGDFLNDYEGIGGYEYFRGDLCLMYFVNIEKSSGKLISLDMAPMQIKHFRLNNANKTDALWLREILDMEAKKLGCHVELKRDNTSSLIWS
jgi:poly-gamma-glutamate capsule biosynthesis protein CapA/YwtB (metallophosphatase superfamily)